MRWRAEEIDFWLWADVFLAGSLAILLLDRVLSGEWAWGALMIVLVVWQGRKAVRAVRVLARRRRSG